MSTETRRVFTPRQAYTANGWFAQVWTTGYADTKPYWRAARGTRLGALLASRRMARKLNRLEQRGLVE